MNRNAILQAASNLINGERKAAYGDVAEAHSRIAAIWSALLGHPVLPAQVPLLLAGMKLARLAHDVEHVDSWIDVAGYAALGGEMTGDK